MAMNWTGFFKLKKNLAKGIYLGINMQIVAYII